MKDRLLKLIEKEQITSAEFADRIGVQRSNVSHILNGRNNPGFSFIQKVLEAFPKVDPRWLIMGEGNMESKGLGAERLVNNDSRKDVSTSNKYPERDLFSTVTVQDNSPVIKREPEPADITVKISEVNSEPPIQYSSHAKRTSSRKIIRALLFYDDNTFDDFSPTDKL